MHLWLFTLVAVLSLARPAHADEPGAVLVSGKASARQQLVASNAVETAVRAAGWGVAGKPYGAADSAAAAVCLRKAAPWTCISDILRDKRIQRVAVVSIDPKPGKHGTTDTVITERLVISNIDSLFVSQRFCDRCTDDKLAGLATEVTKELIDRAAVGSGRTALSIKSTPRGARAYVDSNLVGVTDISLNIVPGTHTITVELEEYRTETRHVLVEEDTTQEVSFALQSSEATSSSRPPFDPDAVAGLQGPVGSDKPPQITRRSRVVPAAIVGVGLATLAAGVVLFALDEDPTTTSGADASRRYRDTGTRGVIVGASGLVIAGAGGYLWWRYSRARSAPVVAPVNGGAVVGIARSF